MFGRTLRTWIFYIFCMFASSSLLAKEAEEAGHVTVYTLGNGYFIKNIFTSVALIFGGNHGVGESPLILALKAFVLLGFLIFLFKAVFFGNPFQLVRSWLGALLLAMLFIFPAPLKVQISNIGVNEGSANYFVSNVPYGIAMSASILSKIGYSISKQINNAFQITDLNGYDANSVLQLFQNVTKAGNDPNVMAILSDYNGYNFPASLRNHLKECVFLKIEKGKLSADQLLSQSLKTMISTKSDLFGTALIKRGGAEENLTCTEASTKLITLIDAIETDVKDNNGKLSTYLKSVSGTANSIKLINNMLGPGASNYGLSSTLSQAEIDRLKHKLSLSSQAAQNFVLASIASNIYDKASSAKYRDYFDQQMAVMVEQARAQRNAQWQGEGTMFVKTMGPLMSFFEGFVYAITPFMVIMLMLGMYGLVLKYFTLLFWVQLWLPINSIINLYIFSGIRDDVNNLFTTVAAVSRVIEGSIYGYFGTQAILSDWVSVGGMLTASVPIISLFVLTGSTYTFTTLASRLGGADHIDEKQIAPSLSQVAPIMMEQSLGNHNRFTGGTNTGADSQVPTISLKKMYQIQEAAQYAEAVAAARSLQHAITNGLTESSQSSIMRDVSAGFMKDTSASTQEGRTFINEKAKALESRYGLSKADSVAIATAATLGFSIAGSGFSAKLSSNSELKSDYNQIQGEAQKSGLSDSVSVSASDKFAAALSGKNGENLNYTDGSSSKDDIAKATNHVRNASQNYAQTHSLASSTDSNVVARLDALVNEMSAQDLSSLNALSRQFNSQDKDRLNGYYEHFKHLKFNNKEAMLMAQAWTAYNSSDDYMRQAGNGLLLKYIDGNGSNVPNSVNDVIDNSTANTNSYIPPGAAGSKVGVYGGFSLAQSNALTKFLLKRESSGGDYGLTNGYGFIGAYQFGASRLQDLGYIKKSVNLDGLSDPQQNKLLDDPNNWDPSSGVHSKAEFLASKSAQDKAFQQHMDGLYKQVARKHPGASKEELAGWMAASHLLGVVGAHSGAGLNKKDGNRTSGWSYFNGAKNAVAKAGEAVDVNKQGKELTDKFGSQAEVVAQANANAEKGAGVRAIPSNVPEWLKENGAETEVKKQAAKNRQYLEITRAASNITPAEQSIGEIEAQKEFDHKLSVFENGGKTLVIPGMRDFGHWGRVFVNTFPEDPGKYSGVPLSGKQASAIAADFAKNNLNSGEVDLMNWVANTLNGDIPITWSELKNTPEYKNYMTNISNNIDKKLADVGYDKRDGLGDNYVKTLEQTIENSTVKYEPKDGSVVNLATEAIDNAPRSEATARQFKSFIATDEYKRGLNNLAGFNKAIRK